MLNSHHLWLGHGGSAGKSHRGNFPGTYEYKRILQAILELLEYSRQSVGSGQVFLSGTLNIFNQPEFKDLNKVKTILGILGKQVKCSGNCWLIRLMKG